MCPLPNIQRNEEELGYRIEMQRINRDHPYWSGRSCMEHMLDARNLLFLVNLFTLSTATAMDSSQCCWVIHILYGFV